MCGRDNLVAPHCACPGCGERDIDALVWRDDRQVQCQRCGKVYAPPGAERELDRLMKVLGAAAALLGARAIEQVTVEDWANLERAVADAMAWIAPET